VEIDGRVGVALAPEHAHDAGALLRMADIALHGGGGDGRRGVALFDPAQQEGVSRRLALFGELRRALSEQELVVYYQPIVTLARGEVTGVEALVRWRHPERGLLLPGEFIDVAEQTGLIHPLTTNVLDQALRDCRGWRDDGTALKVAVNLSAKRVSDTDLPGEVDDLLGRHRLPPSALVLEITESVAMSDPERALAVLGRLRELGTELSVDDFGTGHASLTYLTRLPVSGLKIDRSFVQPMESDAATRTIVRSILHLAGDLGLEVIAEGVETDTAYRSLGAFGCDQAQGFWLARPAPADRVPHLVRDLRARLAGGAPNPAPVAATGKVLPRPRPPAAEPAREG
jgi:EAL domain-containing protein (putative c-di-GMP-specific phosphodiesterase class I)